MFLANAKAVNTNPNVYGPNPKPPSNQVQVNNRFDSSN